MERGRECGREVGCRCTAALSCRLLLMRGEGKGEGGKGGAQHLGRVRELEDRAKDLQHVLERVREGPRGSSLCASRRTCNASSRTSSWASGGTPLVSSCSSSEYACSAKHATCRTPRGLAAAAAAAAGCPGGGAAASGAIATNLRMCSSSRGHRLSARTAGGKGGSPCTSLSAESCSGDGLAGGRYGSQPLDAPGGTASLACGRVSDASWTCPGHGRETTCEPRREGHQPKDIRLLEPVARLRARARALVKRGQSRARSRA